MKDVQRNILALTILYPKEQYKIFRSLDEKHFNGEYRTLFKEMNSLYQGNKAVDPLVLLERLGQEYAVTISELSGIDYIKPNTKAYIKLLVEDYQRREAKKQLSSLLLKLEDKTQSLDNLKNQLLESSKIFENSDDVRYMTYSLNETLMEIYDDQQKKMQYIKSGFNRLDKYVLMDKSNFIILGGRPSSGKTTFAINMALNMAENYKALFFSLETSYKGLGEKIISSYGKIPYSNILNRCMSDDDHIRYLKAADEIHNYELGIVEAAGYTIEQIKQKTLQEKADIIFIDYLQLISEKGNGSFEKVTEISRKLHTLAQQENILVVALSQLRRPEPGKKAQEPTMSDLRQSGQLEQDADAVLLLYDEKSEEENKDISKQTRVLSIAKNKKGKLGAIDYDFYGKTQSFFEWAK